jgi:hypothetical protein
MRIKIPGNTLHLQREKNYQVTIHLILNAGKNIRNESNGKLLIFNENVKQCETEEMSCTLTTVIIKCM